MPTQRKFRKGDIYTTFEEMYANLRGKPLDHAYAYFNHKIMHINFLFGMRVSCLEAAIRGGRIWRAEKND
jgi:hypothetical protein